MDSLLANGNDKGPETFRIERSDDGADVSVFLSDPELTMIVQKYLKSENAFEINPKVVYIL